MSCQGPSVKVTQMSDRTHLKEGSAFELRRQSVCPPGCCALSRRWGSEGGESGRGSVRREGGKVVEGLKSISERIQFCTVVSQTCILSPSAFIIALRSEFKGTIMVAEAVFATAETPVKYSLISYFTCFSRTFNPQTLLY